jgi:hypothetical protein
MKTTDLNFKEAANLHLVLGSKGFNYHTQGSVYFALKGERMYIDYDNSRGLTYSQTYEEAVKGGAPALRDEDRNWKIVF